MIRGGTRGARRRGREIPHSKVMWNGHSILYLQINGFLARSLLMHSSAVGTKHYAFLVDN